MFQPPGSSGENVDGDPVLLMSLPKYGRRNDTANNIPASINAKGPTVLATPTVATSFNDTSAWRHGIEAGCAVPHDGAAEGDEPASKRKKSATRNPGTLAVEMVSTRSQSCCP